jgi:endogenous inhibitor of DNA gyrase (YacG/DUF329 family)
VNLSKRLCVHFAAWRLGVNLSHDFLTPSRKVAKNRKEMHGALHFAFSFLLFPVRKCPTCGKPVEWKDNLWRPFCSERCKLIDFDKWTSEEYRMPGRQINSVERSEQSPQDEADEADQAD